MTGRTNTQIAVTGLGATTPLGGDVTTTWEAVLAGRSGTAPLDPAWLERYELPVTFACRIAVPMTDVLNRQEIKKNDPSGQYALVAAREAGVPVVVVRRPPAVAGVEVAEDAERAARWVCERTG